ncbi:MAG TPA: hypothetical protein VMG60_20500 [Burkholderiaceae bacterium]|nr:hypothetical protein [Burkholderiaceae bacterium]
MSWAFRTFLISTATVAALAAYAWATDKVAWQGECTIYTVRCDQGEWQANRCSGTLRAAERYRFRTLKPHREVLFWIVASAEPSGKLTDCAIEDRRHWVCKGGDASRSITLHMVAGQPVAEAGAGAAHAVEKWRWWLLRAGLPAGSEALE